MPGSRPTSFKMVIPFTTALKISHFILIQAFNNYMTFMMPHFETTEHICVLSTQQESSIAQYVSCLKEVLH